MTYPNPFFLQLGICALLFLLVFGMKNPQRAGANGKAAGLQSVSTAEVDPAESIGKPQFVGNFMPESVMVFWNSTGHTLSAPLENATLLLDQDGSSWFEGTGSVLAGGAGEVTAVEEIADGYRLTIAYDNGLVAAVEPLTGVRVAAQERVRQGQSIGVPRIMGQAAQVMIHVTDGEDAVAAKKWLQ